MIQKNYGNEIGSMIYYSKGSFYTPENNRKLIIISDVCGNGIRSTSNNLFLKAVFNK